MTGVRGVGKTSTARLIAKALNCIGPDGQGGPTIDPCGVCEPCRAIAEGRHIDVIEMDAASHTGVDDVREIIEAVRYAAVSARYKIYIIDEVHMLSRNAFNALAQDARGTAGAREVPVRDHRGQQGAGHRAQPLPAVRLAPHPRRAARKHFAGICAAEGVEAEPEALAIIASAAEGSRARRPVDPRPGDRPRRPRCRRPGHRGARARHARPRRQDGAAPVVRRAARRRSGGDARRSRAALFARRRAARADPLADGADAPRRGRPGRRRPGPTHRPPRSARRSRTGPRASPPARSTACGSCCSRATTKCAARPTRWSRRRWRCCGCCTPPTCPIRASSRKQHRERLWPARRRVARLLPRVPARAGWLAVDWRDAGASRSSAPAMLRVAGHDARLAAGDRPRARAGWFYAPARGSGDDIGRRAARRAAPARPASAGWSSLARARAPRRCASRPRPRRRPRPPRMPRPPAGGSGSRRVPRGRAGRRRRRPPRRPQLEPHEREDSAWIWNEMMSEGRRKPPRSIQKQMGEARAKLDIARSRRRFRAAGWSRSARAKGRILGVAIDDSLIVPPTSRCSRIWSVRAPARASCVPPRCLRARPGPAPSPSCTALELFRQRHQPFRGIRPSREARPPRVPAALRDVVVHPDRARVHDAHVHARLDGVVEEGRVDGLAHGLVAAEAEAPRCSRRRSPRRAEFALVTARPRCSRWRSGRARVIPVATVRMLGSMMMSCDAKPVFVVSRSMDALRDGDASLVVVGLACAHRSTSPPRPRRGGERCAPAAGTPPRLPSG